MPIGYRGFQKGHKLGIGNTYGHALKGRSSPLKGIKHPDNCPHCLRVRTGDKFDRKKWMQAYGKVRQLRRFGLTDREYKERLESQGGCCAICRRLPSDAENSGKRFAVDHDHRTGDVRGFLCTTCNTRLGFLETHWGAIMNYLKLGPQAES